VGHFNAYPLVLGRKLAIDTGTATIDEIIKEGRRQGATVVQVNHPFIPYGYFTSVTGGVAPADSAGIRSHRDQCGGPADDLKVLHTLWNYWNAGITTTSRRHGYARCVARRVRCRAHIRSHRRRGDAKAFAQGLKDGHGYVTFGPLIYRR